MFIGSNVSCQIPYFFAALYGNTLEAIRLLLCVNNKLLDATLNHVKLVT